ncbi:MAG: MFS transporter, partial [Limosilactobacillus sp.]
LLAVGLFTFMASLDASIVNIAIPKISAELGVGASVTEWVVSIYLIIIAIFILPFGRLGDQIGKTTVFKWGTIVFVLGSVISATAANFGWLLGGRAVQALGAAMTMANNMGIITMSFPMKQRARAMSTIATSFALGSIAGPSLGGLIINYLSWNNIFWINVPVGLVAIIAGQKALPKAMRTADRVIFDVPGVVLFAGFIIPLFVAIITGQVRGYDSPVIWAELVGAVLFFGGFIYRERRAANPMLDLTLFRYPDLSMGVAAAFLVFIIGFFYSVLFPFYLINARGFSTGKAGLLLIFIPLTIAIFGPISGFLADRFNGALVTIVALVILLIAQVLIYFLSLHSSIGYFIFTSILFGMGMGLFQSPNNTIIMSAVPASRLGITGGLNALVRNVGMEMGVSLSTAILYTVMSLTAGKRIITYPTGNNGLFITAFHTTYLLAILFMGIAVIIVNLRYYRRRRTASAD